MASVYLVPGFFGFANLGDVRYFGHVERWLARRLPDHAIHVVVTRPTASLPLRAARLARTVAETSAPDEPVHLVGHSSGGLDSRLLVSPGVRLPDVDDPDRLARRVGAVVTVATPHWGTPSARFFTTLQGQRVLRLLSVATLSIVRHGEVPPALILRLARRLAGQAAEPDLLDELYTSLLAEFSVDRRAAVERFFAEVGDDVALLEQLTPGAMQAFNAALYDRPAVRYGSVVTRARRPRLFDEALRAGLSPYRQATSLVYRACWHLASGDTPVAPLLAAQADALRRAWGEAPLPAANDGMVPTLSQVHGRVLHAVDADHLDVLGHYGAAAAPVAHHDWLATGTGYDDAAFRDTWEAVAAFLEAS
ncbi:MAG: hypothetical protein R3F59_37355 [Myxococcota bacterium]